MSNKKKNLVRINYNNDSDTMFNIVKKTMYALIFFCVEYIHKILYL